MGDIIRLTTARKAKAKRAALALAAANRAKFGRTKQEKTRDAERASRAAQTLDGVRRDSEPER